LKGLITNHEGIIIVEAPKNKKTSLADRILKASALIGLAHIFLKFAGLIQAKVATQYLDSSIYESIIVVAYGGVINTLFYVGKELITPTFLTVFMKEKEQKDEKAAWEFANVTLSFQSLLLLVVCATIACFPDFYIWLFTTWTKENKPEAYKLLRISLQFMAPSLFFLTIGNTTYILLNGYKKFFLAAFGDASTKICIIIGLIIGIGIFGLDYHALLFSIVVGSVAKVITHLAGMLSKLKYMRLSFDWRNPAFKSMLLLMLPLLI
jgi:peptidoglycan biosynthesis protein MviN/MurJ (putative lipid II flippase)